jgi:hypothetical protein
MHFAMRIGPFPEPAIIRIPIKRFPTIPAFAWGNSRQMVGDQPLDPLAGRVGDCLATYYQPSANYLGFVSFQFHSRRLFPHCSSATGCHCSGSIFEAMITAWVRLSTPSFCRMAETWAFTVASDTPSA